MTVIDPVSPKKPISPEEEIIQYQCKQLLKSKIFSGYYKERRYCSILNEYRDIIIINDTEKEFRTLLESVQSQLFKYYQNRLNHWIGIQIENEKNLCIWAEVEDLAFENYWFKVKTIKFRDNEIILKLKPLRTIDSDTTEPINNSQYKDIDLDFAYLIKILNSWVQTTKILIIQFLEKDLTVENVVAAIKFMFLLLFAALTFSFEALKLFGYCGIRMLVEFRLLLRTSTPLLLNLMNLMNKIVGGIFILVSMIWRDIIGNRINPNNQPAQPNFRAIQYNPSPPTPGWFSSTTDGSRLFRENNRRRFQ